MSTQETVGVGDTRDGVGDTPDSPGDSVPTSSQLKKRKTMEKRSEVWEHFKAFTDSDDTIKAKCVHCGKVLCGNTKNGTTSLRGHMAICRKKPASSNLKQSQLVFPSPQNPNLTTWNFDQDEIRDALAYMIIVDELPFKHVDKEGFRYFVSKCCPRFSIPSRWTVPRDIYKSYNIEKDKLMGLLKSTNQRVCLTTDTWTSIQRVNYMCLTAHYIDIDWKLHKKIINFCPINSHKGRDIGWEIETCLHKWEIERVFTITVDNASSNVVALNYLKENIGQRGDNIRNCDYMHMKCIAHIFNLVVQDGLKEIRPSVERIRNAVRFVRHSPARLKRFKECCEHEKISSKSLLCLDVPTRWNSTYLMLDAAITFEKAFSRFDVLDPVYRIDLECDGEGVPDKVDWISAKRMLNFLKIFYEITCAVSGCLYVTSNMFLHEIYKVDVLLKAYTDGRDKDLSKMALKMKAKFDKYWGNPMEMNKLIFIAVILDPRYKMKWVKLALSGMYGDEMGSRMEKVLEEELVIMCGEYKQPIMESSQSSGEHRVAVVTSVDDEDPTQKALKALGSMYESFHHRDVNDVDKFLKEDTESNGSKFDILAWWKVNESRFPVLSQLARDVLAVPISTVALESAFSTGGRVLDPFRSSLSPRIVEILICGQDWLHKSSTPVNVEELQEDVETIEEGLRKMGLKDSTD